MAVLRGDAFCTQDHFSLRAIFARSAGFTVSLTGADPQTTGIVLCAQPRALDVLSRNGRKLESVPPWVVDDVLAKLAVLFE